MVGPSPNRPAREIERLVSLSSLSLASFLRRGATGCHGCSAGVQLVSYGLAVMRPWKLFVAVVAVLSSASVFAFL